MPSTLKLLGQAAPGANTDTDLYTVPGSTQAHVTLISACNRGGTAATIRVWARPTAASLANQHYLAYDVDLPANDSWHCNIAVMLGAADILGVRASTANVSWTASGVEIT